MKVLVVEDDVDIAHLKAAELVKAEPKLDITHAPDPYEASRCMQSEQFDVVVTDLSFRDQRNAYAERIKAGNVSLASDTEFLTSGLTVLSDALRYSTRPGSTQGPDSVHPGLVVWTIMDENRTLQVFYAYEKLGVRSFCSKTAPAVPSRSTSETGSLLGAIRRAYDGGALYADAIIEPCLPDSQSIHDTIFKDPKWYGVWRMYALGVSREQSVIKALRLNVKRINGYTSAMHEQVMNLHNLPRRESGPGNVVYGYAQMHWEFFLDDTVMRQYPPEVHHWAVSGEPDD